VSLMPVWSTHEVPGPVRGDIVRPCLGSEKLLTTYHLARINTNSPSPPEGCRAEQAAEPVCETQPAKDLKYQGPPPQTFSPFLFDVLHGGLQSQ